MESNSSSTASEKSLFDQVEAIFKEAASIIVWNWSNLTMAMDLGFS